MCHGYVCGFNGRPVQRSRVHTVYSMAMGQVGVEVHMLDRVEVIAGFLMSHDVTCVDSIAQFLEAFQKGSEDQKIVEEIRARRAAIREREAAARSISTGDTVIVSDDGIVFKRTDLVCPDCGDSVIVAIFCPAMKQKYRDLDASGMTVCVHHPMVAKKLGLEPNCWFEYYIPEGVS